MGTKEKLWTYFESPLTQGGLAVIITVIGEALGLSVLTVIGWVFFCSAIFRTKFFEGKKYRIVGDICLCLLLGLALWGMSTRGLPWLSSRLKGSKESTVSTPQAERQSSSQKLQTEPKTIPSETPKESAGGTARTPNKPRSWLHRRVTRRREAAQLSARI